MSKPNSANIPTNNHRQNTIAQINHKAELIQTQADEWLLKADIIKENMQRRNLFILSVKKSLNIYFLRKSLAELRFEMKLCHDKIRGFANNPYAARDIATLHAQAAQLAKQAQDTLDEIHELEAQRQEYRMAYYGDHPA